jgi:hypothetical protein
MAASVPHPPCSATPAARGLNKCRSKPSSRREPVEASALRIGDLEADAGVRVRPKALLARALVERRGD